MLGTPRNVSHLPRAPESVSSIGWEAAPTSRTPADAMRRSKSSTRRRVSRLYFVDYNLTCTLLSKNCVDFWGSIHNIWRTLLDGL